MHLSLHLLDPLSPGMPVPETQWLLQCSAILLSLSLFFPPFTLIEKKKKCFVGLKRKMDSWSGILLLTSIESFVM